MKDCQMDPSIEGGVKEIAPSLIAVHPLDKSVVVAIGPNLRIFSFGEDGTAVCHKITDRPSHSDSIRSICFDRKGDFFASAGDDKLVNIWNAYSWHCIKSIRSEKRVSAASFSSDARYLMFADKFGVVWIATTSVADKMNHKDDRAEPLLAHCCSIITGLEISPNGRFIASADRDFKIRVSVLPKSPLQGAHEIQSFCLGHTNFVSCISFLGIQADCEGLLISGGGDATVRLWHYMTGELLDTYEAEVAVGLGKCSNGVDNPTSSAVTALSVSSDSSLIAVAIESLYGVLLLNCNLQSRKLALLKKVELPDSFIPTSLAFGNCSHNLWMITGGAEVIQLDGTNPVESEVKNLVLAASAVTRIRVIDLTYNGSSNLLESRVLDDASVPGGEKLLTVLQGDKSDMETARAAAEAANTALKNLMIKRQYSTETRENRKKKRNDIKLKNIT
ncbi:uncharacterized protein LOC131064496 [Cryptomeria japonica]|uniref:uncharacterized protein LOC131064496 n=1 Tax=Cryptomeria japonica TaxID=3369 RepID=UPI0027D9F498|nr:uncharacterized protein LOC131064496 [Cryptomeria japonica]